MADRKKEDFLDRDQAAKVFHDHAADYDNWFAGSLVYAIELAALRSLHTVMVGPKMEIGVGPGRFASDLGLAFGLDPVRAPLHLALQRGIKCCQGIGEELPMKDRTVGTVYLLFTLCFGLDPQKIIEESGRVLMDGGHLVVGMIPAGSAWGRHLEAKKRAGNVFYAHANFYTIANVKAWLAKSDMSVIEYRSTLYQPPGQVALEEEPREALDEQAGFAVIAARKSHG
jgi:ubiquinone/menaquinone biosynthesis C-methylase UbiE